MNFTSHQVKYYIVNTYKYLMIRSLCILDELYIDGTLNSLGIFLYY